MTGGGTQTTTTTANNEPWDASQGFLKNSMNYASGLLDAGIGAQVPTISTAIPFSDQSMAGLTGMENLANANSNGQGLSGFYGNILANGGFSNDQQTANNTFSSFANGSATSPFSSLATAARNNPSMNGFMSAANGGFDVSNAGQLGLAQGASGPSYSEQNLGNWASGQQLGAQNPYFEQALAAATQKTQDAVDLTASGAGRYGSGGHWTALADSIGGMQSAARAQQFESDRNAQFQANNMMDTFKNANFSNALNALNSATGIQQGNVATRMAGFGNAANLYSGGIDQALGALGTGANLNMTGASNLFNSGQTGFSNAADAYSGMMAPYNTLMSVGGNYETLAGNVRQDELNRFYAAQNLPWENLARANAIYSGAGALGGSQTSSVQQPGQSSLANALGLASTGVGIAGGLQKLGWF